jgi:hypothetical protein
VPSATSQVGLLQLPIAAGATDATLADPVVDGLLAYVAHWIKWGLDAKLATMTAPPCKDPGDVTAVADACPTANRFGTDPSLLVESFNKPALFCWWDGRDSVKQFTIVKSMRVRGIQFLYVFDAIKDSDGPSDPDATGIEAKVRWAGLLNVVASLMQRAFTRYSHPTFTPSTTGAATGADIRVSLGLTDLLYEGGQPLGLGEMITEAVRQAASAAGSRQTTEEGGFSVIYPCLRFSAKVTELIGDDEFNDLDNGGTAPDDTGDIFVTLRGAESDLGDPVDIVVGIIPSDA